MKRVHRGCEEFELHSNELRLMKVFLSWIKGSVQLSSNLSECANSALRHTADRTLDPPTDPTTKRPRHELKKAPRSRWCGRRRSHGTGMCPDLRGVPGTLALGFCVLTMDQVIFLDHDG